MLAQRFQNDFVRTFVAAGLNQLGHILFKISRQGDIHAVKLLQLRNKSSRAARHFWLALEHPVIIVCQNN